MKSEKNLIGFIRGVRPIMQTKEIRSMGLAFRNQLGGPFNSIKIATKTLTGGQGLLRHLRNLRTFKVGKIIPNLILGIW